MNGKVVGLGSEVVINGKVIEVRRLENPDEYRMVVSAEAEVWGVSEHSDLVAHHVLIAADRRGGLVLGAFEKDTGRMVGFVFGFLARNSEGKLYHYSHMTGVVPEYRYKGLGYVLKVMQREYVINQGLDLITWTYDPLQPANAKFNIGKLGVIVRKFYENYYGELRDSLNAGMPTDRFEAEWWVKSTLVSGKLGNALRTPTWDEVLALGGVPVTNVGYREGVPVLTGYDLDARSPLIMVEVPDDLSKLRTFRDLLMGWRVGMREVFNRYLNELNYVVVEFLSNFEGGLRRNSYVLWRGSLEQVLGGQLPWSYVK